MCNLYRMRSGPGDILALTRAMANQTGNLEPRDLYPDLRIRCKTGADVYSGVCKGAQFMQSSLGFSGRSGRASYGLLTLAFAAIVVGLAAGQGGLPFTSLASEPWTVLARSLDDLVRIPVFFLDMLVSLVIGGAMLWVWAAMTVRRLRDIGQSPWWAVLVLLSGIVVPSMIALSLVPSTNREEARQARVGLGNRAAAGAE